MYALDVKPTADKIFSKLGRKNPNRLRKIEAKLAAIREQPFHTYKFLRGPLLGFNRVHIDTHFVLIFTINHANQAIEVHYFGHHDHAYCWRPDSKEY